LVSQFDEARIKRIASLAEEASKKHLKSWSAQTVFERLDQAIIGNERYKKSLAISISDFLSAAKLRNHLLVIGPSGTGKTYLLEQCLPDFGIPYVVLDASSLVPSGYKGSTFGELLGEFFRANMTAANKCIIVLDEFDKISEKANGGDTHKSHSLQSELLTLIQGKQEGNVDTRNALWILAGAFAYADETRQRPVQVAKSDLLKYGFKNELLGRITRLAMTDIPTVEEVVRRVAESPSIKSLIEDMGAAGYTVDFDDSAFLALALAAQNPAFGMRVVPSLASDLKEYVVFECAKGAVCLSEDIVKRMLEKQ
jgi:ATP-dependent Clp protease ATP-binding subunit ClpX